MESDDLFPPVARHYRALQEAEADCVKAVEMVRRAVKRQQLGAQGGLASGVAHGKVREGVALRSEAELPLAHKEREQSIRALRLDSVKKSLTQLRRADAVRTAQAGMGDGLHGVLRSAAPHSAPRARRARRRQ